MHGSQLMYNNPFSKAARPKVEHFSAFFYDFYSDQTNAGVPLFQQVFLTLRNLWPTKSIQVVRQLFFD
jgi:hypothetical protein